MKQTNNNKIYKGAIIIFHKLLNNELFFLKAQSKTDKFAFIAGGMEKEDKNDEKNTALREINEELIIKGPFNLVETKLYQNFIFSKHKKQRQGAHAFYKIFLVNAANLEIKPNYQEIKKIQWLNEKETLEKLSFEDLKNIFKKTIEYIKKSRVLQDRGFRDKGGTRTHF